MCFLRVRDALSKSHKAVILENCLLVLPLPPKKLVHFGGGPSLIKKMLAGVQAAMKLPIEPTEIIYPRAIDPVFIVVLESFETDYGKTPVELTRSPVR